MDFSGMGTSLGIALGAEMPRILGAIAILIIGWIVAVLVRAGVRRLLGVLQLNRRVAEVSDQRLDLETGLSAGAFWLIILITLIGMFNSLDLALASGPFEAMVRQIAVYLPRLVAGAFLILIAWLAAVALRAIVNRVLDASGLDEKLSANAGMQPMRKSVGNMLFWLVILLFVPAILDAFDLGGLLGPVQVMVAKILDMLPNVFAALLIGFAGWLLGKVLAGLVTNVLAAAGADRGAHRLGLDPTLRISNVVGTIVLILVFVPALIAALDALPRRRDFETRDGHAGGGARRGAQHRRRSADPRGHLLCRQVRCRAGRALAERHGVRHAAGEAWTRGHLCRGHAAIAAGL